MVVLTIWSNTHSGSTAATPQVPPSREFFCCLPKRRWKSFVIDDRFPTDFTGEACRYVKLSPSGEIWPCLLEKAFAKYSGGYDNINGGNPAFSLAALTGCDDLCGTESAIRAIENRAIRNPKGPKIEKTQDLPPRLKISSEIEQHQRKGNNNNNNNNNSKRHLM